MAKNSENTHLYDNWRNMHRRCYDATYHSFHRYGGRGIKVDERWHSFALFKQDLQSGWYKGATLDREDNNRDYSLENCRWLPKSQNTKPYKHRPEYVLELYESGYNQYEIAKLLETYQPHVCRLLKKARAHGAQF